MKERIKLYKRWAQAALAQYGIDPAIRYIGHSDNITFQVTDNTSKAEFLLRIHSPVTHHLLGMRQNPEVIESELIWLDALAADTSIMAPRPVRNRAGQFVTPVTREDGNMLQSTLLTWVKGEHIRLDEPQATAEVHGLGILLSELHTHARAWQPPPGFVRPAYGRSFFHGIAETLRQGVTRGLIRDQDYGCIGETLARAAGNLAALEPGPENWGLIHNDLHPGNCVVNGDSICPIDFSLCGFGYYLFDIGTSLGSLPQGMRSAFLEGYARGAALPPDYQRLVEGSLIISRMSYYALVLPDPSHQDWLRTRIPQVVEAVCSPFLRGESFLFTTR